MQLQALNRYLEYDPGYVAPAKEALNLIGPPGRAPARAAPRAHRRGEGRGEGCAEDDRGPVGAPPGRGGQDPE